MNPKQKSRRCRGLGLDSGLDLAISRFIYSLVPYPSSDDRNSFPYNSLEFFTIHMLIMFHRFLFLGIRIGVNNTNNKWKARNLCESTCTVEGPYFSYM